MIYPITILQLYYYHMKETDFYYFKQHDVIFVTLIQVFLLL